LTLRSYLRTILAIPELGSSPVFRSFLTSGPTKLTSEEIFDSQRREDLDQVREQGKTQFEKEVSERVDKLRDSVKDVKGDLMGPGTSICPHVSSAVGVELTKHGLMNRGLNGCVRDNTGDAKLYRPSP
jgi:hypothetical protein